MAISSDHYSDSINSSHSTGTNKPSPSLNQSTFESAIKDMQEKYKQQLNQAIGIKSNYRDAMGSLKKCEIRLSQDLNVKRINPEDPELDVEEVFVIARNKRSRRKRRRGDLNKEEKIAEVNFGASGEELLNIDIAASRGNELDAIFGTERNFKVEYESEEETPYIPQSIAQVFL